MYAFKVYIVDLHLAQLPKTILTHTLISTFFEKLYTYTKFIFLQFRLGHEVAVFDLAWCTGITRVLILM